MKTILVGYDTSPQAEKAFAFALDLATKYGAGVLVVSVASPPEPPSMVETQAALDNAREFFEAHFSKLRDAAAKTGVALECLVLIGHPAEQIVRLAMERKADIIAMGHRGRSAIEQWLLGSVARRVLNHAPCTITIVR